MDTAKKNIQTVILENRERLNLSGINEVKSFNDEEIVLFTELGELHIRGNNLKVMSFNVETGDMSVDGKVSALGYRGNKSSKGGKIARIFK